MLSVTSTPTHPKATPWLPAGVVLLTAAVFALDCVTPQAYAVWIFYLIPLMLTGRARARWYPLVVAALCTVLVLFGFFLAPLGIKLQVAILNRAVGVGVLWFMAALLVRRKRAEEALHETGERLRLFVEHAPAAIAMFDGNMNYIAASNRWFSDYGVKDRNIIGRSHYEVFPDLPERWRDIHRRCLAGAVEKSEAEPWIRVDGSTEWVQWEIRPWRKSDDAIGGLIIFSEVITQRKQAEEALRESEARLRMSVQSAQEAERLRIARELHDELGQLLTGLKMEMSGMAHKLRRDQSGLHEPVAATLNLLDSCIFSVRKIATELRPGLLDALGLAAAIEWQVEEFQARTGVSCSLTLPREKLALPDDQATALFRILQEALTNIARHAQAKHAEVRLAVASGRLVLEVLDDGRGIRPDDRAKARSLGIVGMRERALLLGGEVEVTGSPGSGTTVRASVPVEAPSTGGKA